MNKIDKQNLEQSIQNVVANFDGKLSLLTFSKNGNSAYALSTFSNLRYDVFRISQHKTYKSYFSHPTFRFTRETQQAFENQLKNYLAKSTKGIFGYSEYFCLSAILCGLKHNTSYFIDDSFQQFSEETTGVIFCQKSGYTKKTIHVTTLDSPVNQVFRKLYGDGLINTFQKGLDNIQVYVTALGKRLLDNSYEVYQEYFLEDQRAICWHDLRLPVRVESDDM